MDTKADTDQLQFAHNKSIIIILYSSMLLAAAAYVRMLGLIKAQSVYLRNQVLPHIDPKLRLVLVLGPRWYGSSESTPQLSGNDQYLLPSVSDLH